MLFSEHIKQLVPLGAKVLLLQSKARLQDEFEVASFDVRRRYLDEIDLGALSGTAPDHMPDAAQNGEATDGPYLAIVLLHYRLTGASPIDLLNFVRASLERGGYFFCSVSVEGQVASRWSGSERLGFFLAIARRCGFSVTYSEILDPNEASGEYGVILERESIDPRWGLYHLREADLPGFVNLFRDSFNAEVSLDLWRWKYGGGRGRTIVAKRGERLVAHYGSTIRSVSYFGEPGEAVQICDVMVDPRERGVMTKKGAMFITTATYLEAYLGLADYTIAYGFPNRRHMQLGEKLGLYGEVARMVEVRWPVSDGRPRLRTRVSFVERDHPKHGGEVDGLWGLMQRDLRDAVVVKRDWSYLRYRYFSHPTVHYEVICVRSRLSGTALGVMVLRRETDSCELVDIVAPLARLPWIIDQARRMAGRWGFPTLYCWATEHHAERFRCGGGVVNPLDVSVPTSVWLTGQSTDHLIDRWWLMSGDTEFR